MFVRKGAYIGHNVVVMSNAFVNIGAHVDEGSMIDSCTTIGSCAQIGKRCHISSNVMIGGVLEPLQATPVIIENDCFIGAGSVLSEGIIVGEGAVLGTGVQIGASTKIVNRETGEIMYGYIPPYSVVVPGSFITEAYGPGLSLQCAVIVKTVDAVTREKTAINSLLRDAARA
jgi:2,3,4,5-tetrahydropyridine-2-carboxylate N-succinyltransferase